MSRLLFASAALALTLSTAVHSQPGPDTRYSPDEIRSDFTALHDTLEAAHYDLYALTPRTVFDQRRAEMLAGFDTSMSRAETMIAFQTYLALARIGHRRIDFPFDAWAAWREGGGVALPVDIRVRQGRVLVEADRSGQALLAPGDEILAINGEPNAIWMARLTRHLSAETAHFRHTLLELYLPALIWVEYPWATALELRVRRGDGAMQDLTVPLLAPGDSGDGGDDRPERFSLEGFEARMLTDGVAYLRPGPFYNTAPGGQVWDNVAHIERVDTAFESFLESEAEALILDLRDNPGGDAAFSDPVIAWFADTPFSFTSQFSVRVSETTTAANAERLSGMSNPEGGTSARYADLFDAAENGEIIEIDWPLVHPRSGPRFDGPVYALVNLYSFSNAVTVAALLQDYGFATIAGETTADTATTYGAMERFTLPETRISVGYPKALIVRPNGEAEPHPVTPDLALDLPLLRGADDIALEQLIAHIERAAASPSR